MRLPIFDIEILEPEKLADFLRLELEAVAADPRKGVNLPAYKPSTIKRRASLGLDTGDKLRRTGELLQSIRVEKPSKDILLVTCLRRLFFLKRWGRWAIYTKSQINRAINRAIARWRNGA